MMSVLSQLVSGSNSVNRVECLPPCRLQLPQKNGKAIFS